MSNPWYEKVYNALAGVVVRSKALRDEFALVQQGFEGLRTNVSYYAVDSGGVANTYVITTASTFLTSYVDGLHFRVKTTRANSSGATLNVNGLGAKTIVRSDGAVLQTGDILANTPFEVTYNSTLGKFVLNMGALGAAGTNASNGLEVYEERANTATTIANSDHTKKIKITGAGGSTQLFDTTIANYTDGFRTHLWNGTTGNIQITTNGLTFNMWPGERREIYVNKVDNRLDSRVLAAGTLTATAVGAGNDVWPPGYAGFMERIVGGGAGGGGGGGGGSGRGINSGSGSGGSGGSGGAGGQCGQPAQKFVPTSTITPGAAFSYNIGDGGAGGGGGGGGAGALSGAAGNNGNNGNDGSAGTQTTIGASTDAFYLLAAGGTAGNNKGLAGTAGNNNNAGGAAVTNAAALATSVISSFLGIFGTTVNGGVSTAGTNQTSAAPGTAGGAGGSESATYRFPTGAAGPAGGGGSAAVPTAGTAGTAGTPATRAGAGGMGGGGGGGSCGVGAGGSAATGNGGAGGNGAKGGAGEIEIVGVM